MKIFKNYTFSWWQLGLFKLALLTLGALIGSYWPAPFLDHFYIFLVLAIVIFIYLVYLALKQ